jgi:excisionase family DNA binding protein
MNNRSLDPLLVSVPEAARMIGLGKSKFYELVKIGDFKIVKLGGRSLVSTDELRAYVAAKVTQASRSVSMKGGLA